MDYFDNEKEKTGNRGLKMPKQHFKIQAMYIMGMHLNVEALNSRSTNK